MWHGRKPNLKHLRRFGAVARVWIPDNQRSKLTNEKFAAMAVKWNGGNNLLVKEDKTIVNFVKLVECVQDYIDVIENDTDER